MNLRQALALTLSTDLHAVARTLKDADDELTEVREGIQAVLRGAPPELKGQGIYAFLDATLEQLIDAETMVIGARAALTGRSPEALLKNLHNRG